MKRGNVGEHIIMCKNIFVHFAKLNKEEKHKLSKHAGNGTCPLWLSYRNQMDKCMVKWNVDFTNISLYFFTVKLMKFANCCRNPGHKSLKGDLSPFMLYNPAWILLWHLLYCLRTKGFLVAWLFLGQYVHCCTVKAHFSLCICRLQECLPKG